MNDLDDRLVRCLQTVFPTLPASAVRQASQDNVEAWDSVAMLTLFTVVEEEFGVVVDYDRVEELTSFTGLLQYLRDQRGPA